MEYKDMSFMPAEGAEKLEIRVRMVLKYNSVSLNEVQQKLGFSRQYIFMQLRDGAIQLRLGILQQIMDVVGYDVIVKITKQELTALPKTGTLLSELVGANTPDGEIEMGKDIAGLRVIPFVDLINRLGYKVYFSFVHRETGEVM